MASLLTVGIGCPTVCRVGVDSEVGGSSFLVIAWVGDEGGTVYSSILLLIEEAGVVVCWRGGSGVVVCKRCGSVVVEVWQWRCMRCGSGVVVVWWCV